MLKPGGRIVVATWCQRDEGDRPFSAKVCDGSPYGKIVGLVITNVYMWNIGAKDVGFPILGMEPPLFHIDRRLQAAHGGHGPAGISDHGRLGGADDPVVETQHLGWRVRPSSSHYEVNCSEIDTL